MNGIENPLRWPGSMNEFPAVEEVKRYIDICAEHLDDDRSEGAIRLDTMRAFQPFGFGLGTRIDPAEREAAIAAGMRAAELARGYGRLDLESAALDGAASAIITLGLYGRLRDNLARRLEIAEQIEDPWEAGDAYAMASGNFSTLGEYEESIRLGLLARRDRAEPQAAGNRRPLPELGGHEPVLPWGVGPAARGLPGGRRADGRAHRRPPSPLTS